MANGIRNILIQEEWDQFVKETRDAANFNDRRGRQSSKKNWHDFLKPAKFGISTEQTKMTLNAIEEFCKLVRITNSKHEIVCFYQTQNWTNTDATTDF